MKRINVYVFVLLVASPFVPALAAQPSAVQGSIPALNLRTFGGGRFNLAAERGKWVVLNQWATWCGPCLREMPALSAWVRAHGEHVAALGLAYDGISPSNFAKFMQGHPVSYPVALVNLENPPKALPEPEDLPSTFLIAPDGRVVRHLVGPVNAGRLDAAIDAARALHKNWPAP